MRRSRRTAAAVSALAVMASGLVSAAVIGVGPALADHCDPAQQGKPSQSPTQQRRQQQAPDNQDQQQQQDQGQQQDNNQDQQQQDQQGQQDQGQQQQQDQQGQQQQDQGQQQQQQGGGALLAAPTPEPGTQDTGNGQDQQNNNQQNNNQDQQQQDQQGQQDQGQQQQQDQGQQQQFRRRGNNNNQNPTKSPSPSPTESDHDEGECADLGPFVTDFVDIRQVGRGQLANPQFGRNGSRGTFVSACGTNGNKHNNPDNFIVAPGVSNGAHHLHDYVGNLTTDGFSTDQSLAAGGTTCRFGDKSAYFWPVLRDRKVDVNTNDQDGNVGQVLRARQVTLQFRGNATSRVVAMPRFLRIITGDAKAATNGGANAKAAWTCTGFQNRITNNK